MEIFLVIHYSLTYISANNIVYRSTFTRNNQQALPQPQIFDLHSHQVAAGNSPSTIAPNQNEGKERRGIYAPTLVTNVQNFHLCHDP